MRGTKAKALRRLNRDKVYDENGKYKTTPDLRIANEIEKKFHTVDESGEAKLVRVRRITAVNVNKYQYRKDKKAYMNGDFTI